MERLPPLPPIDSPGFDVALSAWLEKTGWSKARLADIIGIDRKQITRWTSARKRQRPQGRAAELYRAFRSSTLIPILRMEKASIDSRIEAIKKISFEAS